MDVETEPRSRLFVDVIETHEAKLQFSNLLDQCFPVPQGRRFFDDFPVWDDRNPVKNIFRMGVFDGRHLISSAAVRITSLKTSSGVAEVGLIGAVTTHPEWRSRGLASQTVSLAVDWAAERGASLAVLWSSEHAMYEKLGFKLVGHQVRVPLSSLQLGTVSAVNHGWIPALFDCLKRREGGLVLSDEDRVWIEAHRNVEWFWTGSTERPTAYAALGRGIDLQGFVHEWGGETEALPGILSAIREKNPQAILLGSPDLLRARSFAFEPSAIEPLCFGRFLRGKPADFWMWGLDGA